MIDDCPFCAIVTGRTDQELIVLRTPNVLVIPTLKQRAANPGQVVVLPTEHVTALHRADPALLTELFETASHITAIAPAAFDAVGTTVFNNNDAPDQTLPHLHIHVVPRYAGDGFVIPNPDKDPAPRELRAEIAERLRQALANRDRGRSPGSQPGHE